ncbi:hypothetical protein V6N13_107806 [Hibiscus sabdariffa]|uniref:Uncharacterized protein n=1 Tax=Hibiscus sabdariffa TaxID=183260 RepID=A0ABR2SQN9_9ROSI
MDPSLLIITSSSLIFTSRSHNCCFGLTLVVLLARMSQNDTLHPDVDSLVTPIGALSPMSTCEFKKSENFKKKENKGHGGGGSKPHTKKEV